MELPDLPTPTMLSVIVALGIAEIEEHLPGFTDRLMARLSATALRADVIRLRGPRALPDIIKAQEQALIWLTAIKPFVAPEKKRKGKGI